MNLILAIAGLALLAVAVSSGAQTTSPQSGGSVTQPGATALIEGEVRKIDKEQGKITLRHGPMPSLEMPAMTMVFRVKDPAVLERVQVGDKVRFAADKINGQYTVMSIEKAK